MSRDLGNPRQLQLVPTFLVSSSLNRLPTTSWSVRFSVMVVIVTVGMGITHGFRIAGLKSAGFSKEWRGQSNARLTVMRVDSRVLELLHSKALTVGSPR